MKKTVSPSGYLRIELKTGESVSYDEARAALATARKRDPDLTHVAVVRAVPGFPTRHLHSACGCSGCGSTLVQRERREALIRDAAVFPSLPPFRGSTR